MAMPCAKTRPVPLGGEAVLHGFRAEALAALGLRPEVVKWGKCHLEYTGACVVARPCDIDISLRPSA
jgi:hypothetical protein